MALLCAAIRQDLGSLLRFPLFLVISTFSHVRFRFIIMIIILIIIIIIIIRLYQKYLIFDSYHLIFLSKDNDFTL